VERVSYDLARAFAAQGHETSLLGRGWPGAEERETLGGLKVTRLRGYPSSPSVAFNLVLDYLYSRRLLQAMPEADLWSTNSFWLPRLALRRRKGSRPAIVVNAQRMPHRQYGLYRGVDGIMVISEAVGAAIRRQAPWTAPLLRRISNPVDLAAFHPEPAPSRPGPPCIVFSGRITPTKGLRLLVAACAGLAREFPGLRLRLIGTAEVARGGAGPGFVRELRELAVGLTLEFAGQVTDRRELASELRRASAYVYPSIDDAGEALGVAPMEAMACGVPVVLSALPCFADYARDGANCLVFSHRAADPVRELARALSRLLRDPALSAALAAAGAADMAALGVEGVAASHLAFFSDILAARPAQ
jgi:glycosyltransferase involved in cell wall biosynthesis